MLKLEKSLVFFSTSLKANEIVLEKMMKTNMIKRYPDDEDLLEDVIVENKQAIEMCTIYRDILSGTMDAFASVISNNLNIVMKFLTSVTIILAIPALFGSTVGHERRRAFHEYARRLLDSSGRRARIHRRRSLYGCGERRCCDGLYRPRVFNRFFGKLYGNIKIGGIDAVTKIHL